MDGWKKDGRMNYFILKWIYFYRLFGLTPIIETTCSRPTELLVWEATPTTFLINPWALIGLYWILGIDCQLWLTTPVSVSVSLSVCLLV